jgi:hypothetical protein
MDGKDMTVNHVGMIYQPVAWPHPKLAFAKRTVPIWMDRAWR